MSYYTAWLKHYYPVEYLASLMSFSTKEDVGLYVKNAKDYGVKVLPPDVNCSLHYTAPTRNGEIRFGLEGLKDVGAAAEKIVRERKTGGAFKSLDDFVLRCVIIGVDKAPIESLVKAGALDELVHNKQEVVENIPTYVAACRTAIRVALKKAEEEGSEPDSRWVYNTINAEKEFKLPDAIPCAEYDNTTIARLEKEYAGFYVSGNPLEKHKNILTKYAHTPILEITESEDVTLVGHISDLVILRRKSDGKPMCKFNLEDLTGDISAVCFVKQYEKLSAQLTEGSIVLLKGKVEAQNDVMSESDEEKSFQLVIRSGRKLT